MKNNKFIILLSLILLVPIKLYSQVYELQEKANPWNQGRNINGLRQDSTSISYAELYGRYDAGGFHQFSEAESSWKIGAIAESMLHLEKMSLKGLFSFENRQEYKACGSMLIKQKYYPVDLIEFTPGNKTRQRYAFDGGLSYDISPEFRIGAKLAFTSMNWSKRKDLRYTNYLLDLNLLPSILWHKGDWTLGLSYILTKNAESIKASQIGSTEDEYMIFLDKGLRYGSFEQWESSGVHLKESGTSGFPIREILNGPAVQIQWKNLYLDAEYLYGSGKAGEKDLIWFRFPSHNIKLHLNYNLFKSKFRHFFRLNVNYRYLENKESLLEKEAEGNIIHTNMYAKNLIYKNEEFVIKPEYELITKKWRINWMFEYLRNKSISSQIFPYICTGLQNGFQTVLNGHIHIWKFELGANIGFAIEKISEKQKTISNPGDAPIRIKEYSDPWLCYERAPKIDSGLSLRYRFWHGLYAEMEGNYLRALNINGNEDLRTWFTNPDRWGISLKLGWNF